MQNSIDITLYRKNLLLFCTNITSKLEILAMVATNVIEVQTDIIKIINTLFKRNNEVQSTLIESTQKNQIFFYNDNTSSSKTTTQKTAHLSLHDFHIDKNSHTVSYLLVFNTEIDVMLNECIALTNDSTTVDTVVNIQIQKNDQNNLYWQKLIQIFKASVDNYLIGHPASKTHSKEQCQKYHDTLHSLPKRSQQKYLLTLFSRLSTIIKSM